MPERSGNAECSQPVLGCTDSRCLHLLHLLSKGNPFPLQRIYSHYLFLPQGPFMPICRISVILLEARWSLGRFLVGFSQVPGTCLHPDPFLLPGTFPPFLIAALGLWLLRGDRVGLGLPLVPSPCPQKQLLLLASLAFPCSDCAPFEFRYIPIQKSLPFFLLPYFHRQLDVKFLLLSFLLLFSLVM